MKLLLCSLEKLVSYTPKEMFKHTSKYFKEKTDLMLDKQVYPNEYMNSFDRLDEPCLPSVEEFGTSLNEGVVYKKWSIPSEIQKKCEKRYEHVVRIFRAFGCRDLRDYTRLYCKSDVLLLADIFENFIDVSMKIYNLDPSHYLTASSLYKPLCEGE